MRNKIVVLSLIFIIIFIFTSCAAMGMDQLPNGEFMDTVYSPNGTYQINSYLVSGNATTDFSVRCEVVEISSGKKRNIYWEYHCETADIEWIDDTNVKINEKKLNVITDSYDWRND